MSDRFQQRRARLNSVTDRQWAEKIRHFPLLNAAEDKSREQLIFHAVLRTAGEKLIELKDRGIDLEGSISAGKAELMISMSAYEPLRIKQGDKIRALDRPNEPWFLVETIEDRRRDRLIINLSEAN